MSTHFDSDIPLISDLNLVLFNSRSSNPVQQTLGKAPVFSASPVPALPSILSSSPSAFTPTSSSPSYFLSRPLNTNMAATSTTDSDVDNDEVQSIDIESVKGRKGKNSKASASTSSNKKKRHRTWLADELKTLWNAVYSKKPYASDAAKLKQWGAVSNELAKAHTDIDWNQRSVQRNWEDSIAAFMKLEDENKSASGIVSIVIVVIVIVIVIVIVTISRTDISYYYYYCSLLVIRYCT